MKKLLVLLMVLLSICSSVFAESFEDVLKDCKLATPFLTRDEMAAEGFDCRNVCIFSVPDAFKRMVLRAFSR